jgi:transcription elongation factor S-II
MRRRLKSSKPFRKLSLIVLSSRITFQPETSTTYKQKMRSLFQNLKIKNNEQLRAEVYSGAITPDKFGKSWEGTSRPPLAN